MIKLSLPSSLLTTIKGAWQRLIEPEQRPDLSDVPISRVDVQYKEHFYRAAACTRYVSIQRLPDGKRTRFSTDNDAEYCDLARQVFDGFEWDLSGVVDLIKLYELP